MALLAIECGSVIEATGVALAAVIEANTETIATKVAIMSFLIGFSFVVAVRPFKPFSFPRKKSLALQPGNVTSF